MKKLTGTLAVERPQLPAENGLIRELRPPAMGIRR